MTKLQQLTSNILAAAEGNEVVKLFPLNKKDKSNKYENDLGLFISKQAHIAQKIKAKGMDPVAQLGLCEITPGIYHLTHNMVDELPYSTRFFSRGVTLILAPNPDSELRTFAGLPKLEEMFPITNDGMRSSFWCGSCGDRLDGGDYPREAFNIKLAVFPFWQEKLSFVSNCPKCKSLRGTCFTYYNRNQSCRLNNCMRIYRSSRLKYMSLVGATIHDYITDDVYLRYRQTLRAFPVTYLCSAGKNTVYLRDRGMDLTPLIFRNEIISACLAAGIPVETEPPEWM